MSIKTIMVVAGDPSGDAIAADLVRALAAALPTSHFIGAGGPLMAAAGVANSFDLTADAVIGLSDVFRKLPRFGRRFQLLQSTAGPRDPPSVVARLETQACQIRFTAGLGLASGARRRHGARFRPAALPVSV
jgi:lipid A disaccharide synthetase